MAYVFGNVPYHIKTAAVAQWSGAFAPQAESWVFKTGSDSSTAKRSALGVSVTGPRRWPYKRISRVTVGLSLLNGHECRAHVKICSYLMSEKSSIGTKTPKTNKSLESRQIFEIRRKTHVYIHKNKGTLYNFALSLLLFLIIHKLTIRYQ